MTNEEITKWEHRPNVITMLTSYEMGEWLHRRDCRLLEDIRNEIEARKHNSGGEPNRELAFNVCLEIIDKYTSA
jgi:hypothetical protein